MTTYDNWPSVVTKLMNYRKKWAWISGIIGREEINAWTPSNFYKAVVQAVLIFFLDVWAVTPALAGYWGDSSTGCHTV